MNPPTIQNPPPQSLELAPFNIKVVLAAPGFVSSTIHANTVSHGHVFVDRKGPYAPIADRLNRCMLAGGGMDTGCGRLGCCCCC